MIASRACDAGRRLRRLDDEWSQPCDDIAIDDVLLDDVGIWMHLCRRHAELLDAEGLTS